MDVTRSIRPRRFAYVGLSHVGARKCAEGTIRRGGTHPVEIELGFVALSRYPARLFGTTRARDTKARSNPFKAALSARARRHESRMWNVWTRLDTMDLNYTVSGRWLVIEEVRLSPLKATPSPSSKELRAICRATELLTSEWRTIEALMWHASMKIATFNIYLDKPRVEALNAQVSQVTLLFQEDTIE